MPSLAFIKHRFLPLYTNVGKTLTKGISYRLQLESARDFRKKAFLIYDVPSYFEIDIDTHGTGLGLYRSTQYPGFLIDLEHCGSVNEFLATTFSKSSRYKLKKYKKRFDASFDVRYVMYRGEMARETYNHIFDSFRKLLEKRFDDKQITNNNLDPKEWQFYYELTYPMLLEKTASLFVIYNGDEPIGVTLNFFSEDILFDAITVFDIDYAKFHLGSNTILGLLEWCLANGVKIFDFSKGYFDYKTRWATKTYDFEYHIYYDCKSIRARTIAYLTKRFFDLKNYLREKKYNERLHRMTYRLKGRSSESVQHVNYRFHEIDPEGPIDTTRELPLDTPENHHLRPAVFEFLYLNQGHYRDVRLYATPTENHYLLTCNTKRVLLTLE